MFQEIVILTTLMTPGHVTSCDLVIQQRRGNYVVSDSDAKIHTSYTSKPHLRQRCQKLGPMMCTRSSDNLAPTLYDDVKCHNSLVSQGCILGAGGGREGGRLG